MTETITIKAEGQMLDQVLWQKFGVRGRELTEKTLELNPGLSAQGAFLPIGRVITLPELPKKTSLVQKPLTLFG